MQSKIIVYYAKGNKDMVLRRKRELMQAGYIPTSYYNNGVAGNIVFEKR